MSTESSEGRGGWGGRGRGAYRGGYNYNNNNINEERNGEREGERGYRGGYRGGYSNNVGESGGYRGRGGYRGGYNSNRGEYNNSNRGGERGGYRGGRGGYHSRPVHNSGVELPADYKFPTLVDIGVNLTHKRFKHDLDNIVSLSAERGVTKLIITGTSLRESIAAVKLCEKYPKIMTCTVGVHPHDAKTCNETTISDLRKLAAEPSVCAIGECGLDYDRMFTPQPVQEMWFQKQLELAEELKKPVFLHERAAHSDFMKILSPFLERGLKAVVHCFTGTEEEAKEYMKHKNILLGLTATCTHKNERGERIRKVLQSGAIPLERLMIETDAPFMTPHNIPVNFNHSSDRNDPSLLFCVVDSLSLIFNVSRELVADTTTRNAVQFFGLH